MEGTVNGSFAYTSLPMNTMMPMNGTTGQENNIMGIFRLAFTLILMLIMFGMGCAVDYKILINNLKRPVGIVVGVCCQIILMPVLTFALIKIFQLNPLHSLAFFLVGCAPGGNNSNVITYLVRGNISLSVAMTSVSNVLNIATVPFWLFVYTSIEGVDESMRIPFHSLVLGILSILIPISIGIAFRYKFPKQAPIITKVMIAVALVMLIIALTTMLIVAKVPFIFSVNTFLPVAILPLAGMTISYGIASIPLFQLTKGSRKAVAIEAAIQNSSLANLVLVHTFSDRLEMLGSAIPLPLLYSIAQASYVILLVGSYRIWYRCQKNAKRRASRGEDSHCSDSEIDQQKVPFDLTTKESAGNENSKA